MIGYIEDMKTDTAARLSSSGDGPQASLTRLTLVTGGKWTDRDGNERDTTERFQVAAFGRLSDLCNEYLANGAHAYIEGRVKTRRWRERDLTERTSLEIDATTIVPLSGKESATDLSSVAAAYTLNKMQIIGRLGRDPEMRYTEQGTPVTNFSVATGGKWTDREGKERDDTEWFRIDAWERLAEICNQYLTKGTRVYIEGRYRVESWTDRDGNERLTAKVVASDMTILSSKGEVGRGGPELDDLDQEGGYSPPPPPTRGGSRSSAPSRQQAPSNVTPMRPAASSKPSSRTINEPKSIDEDDIPF